MVRLREKEAREVVAGEAVVPAADVEKERARARVRARARARARVRARYSVALALFAAARYDCGVSGS